MTERTHLTFSAAVTITDERVFAGVAVPYGVVTRDGRNVRFAAGAFGDLNSQALTALMIQHPMNAGEKAVRVGRVLEWTDTDDALTFSARLNDSTEADGIYAALKSGDIAEVSVGVYVDEFTEDSDGITTFSSASLLELSLITEGSSAFADSRILVVHAEEPAEATASTTPNEESSSHMENNTNIEVAQFNELKETVESLDRAVTQFSEQPLTETAPAVPFTSMGEYVKAFSAGDPQAITFAKDVQDFAANGTSADSVIRNGWSADVIRLVEKPRKVINAFSTSPLPAEGMNVETGILDTNSLQVAIQANEFDQIVKGNISVDSVFEPIKTFAGGADVSRQAIERASVSYLDLNWRGMAIAYSAQTEAYVRAKYLSAQAQSVSGVNLNDTDSVTDFLFDAGGMLEDQGLTADVAVLTRDNAKKLAKLRSGGTAGDYFLNRSQGTINLLSADGNLAGVPFVIVPGTGHFSVASSQALRTWENGGPFRLQHEEVDTLSQTLALYGYLAAHVQIPNGIVKAS